MYNSIPTLVSVVKSIKRNTFGVVAVTETEPRMKKGGNPYVGRVKKVTRYSNVALGRDYYKAVEGRAERLGLPNGKMEVEKPNGMTWDTYPYFLVSDKNPNQFYLRLTQNKNTIITSTYYVDGREATADEVIEIKSFIYDNHLSQKQAALGIDEDNQVKPLSFKVENIVSIEQGAFFYHR